MSAAYSDHQVHMWLADALGMSHRTIARKATPDVMRAARERMAAHGIQPKTPGRRSSPARPSPALVLPTPEFIVSPRRGAYAWRAHRFLQPVEVGGPLGVLGGGVTLYVLLRSDLFDFDPEAFEACERVAKGVERYNRYSSEGLAVQHELLAEMNPSIGLDTTAQVAAYILSVDPGAVIAPY